MSYLSNYTVYEEKHLGTLNSVWDRCEYDRYRNLKPSDIVVDAGASMGAFTVKAALQAKFVYAFEPEPENFGYLKKNADKLGGNIMLFNKALSSASGKQLFYISQNWGGHSLIPKADNRTIEVETVTLDEVVDYADFLKVDVEASELDVFKGATNILRECKPFIAVEVHNKQIFADVREFLAPFGYTCKYGIIDSTVVEITQPTYGTVYFEAT